MAFVDLDDKSKIFNLIFHKYIYIRYRLILWDRVNQSNTCGQSHLIKFVCLKRQTKIAADDILTFYFYLLKENKA